MTRAHDVRQDRGHPAGTPPRPGACAPAAGAPPAGAPARRRRLSRGARRDAILAAAGDVFASRGYEEARMADVAAAAGVAKGLLYQHFPTKEALYAAVLERQAAAFEARVERRLVDQVAGAAARGLADPVVFGMATWLDQVFDDLGTGQLPNPGDHDLLDAFRQRIRSVAARHLGLVRPELGEDGARLVAAAVLGATEAAGRAWLADPGRLGSEDLRALVEGLLLPGLAGINSSGCA